MRASRRAPLGSDGPASGAELQDSALAWWRLIYPRPALSSVKMLGLGLLLFALIGLLALAESCTPVSSFHSGGWLGHLLTCDDTYGLRRFLNTTGSAIILSLLLVSGLILATPFSLVGMIVHLTPRERALLSDETWSISAIVLWEIAKLAELGRIELDLDHAELTRILTRILTWPLTLDICRSIKSLDFDSDPADEIIAATSLVHRIPLVTRDRRMRRSKLVPIAS